MTDDAYDSRFRTAYLDDWKAVFRLALAWTNDWGEAEQIAQEAFARLWQRRATVDWTKPVLAWLLVVARRLCTDRFRRLRSHPVLVTSRVAPMVGRGEVEWLEVREAFSKLTPSERSGLVLVTVLGFSPAEAAGLLGTGDGAVRAAISRGRAKLRREVA